MLRRPFVSCFVFRAAWHKYPAAVSVLVVVEQYIFIASVDAIAFVRLQHQQRHSEGKLYCGIYKYGTVGTSTYGTSTVGTVVPWYPI